MIVLELYAEVMLGHLLISTNCSHGSITVSERRGLRVDTMLNSGTAEQFPNCTRRDDRLGPAKRSDGQAAFLELCPELCPNRCLLSTNTVTYGETLTDMFWMVSR
jgi:hypothetical protein